MLPHTELIRVPAGPDRRADLNAGISEPRTLAAELPEHFDRRFGVNVRGTVVGLQAAVEATERGRSGVLMGSIADVMGVTPYGTYAATKAALRSYARTWTAELAPLRIRVNVVAPGPANTAVMTSVPRRGGPRWSRRYRSSAWRVWGRWQRSHCSC